jgi:serine/threonine protein kinase
MKKRDELSAIGQMIEEESAKASLVEADPNIGRSFKNRYRVDGVIGKGGMGTVYRARDTLLNDRAVAVKVLMPYLASIPDFRRRFEREARLAASIEHENVVRVYDVNDPNDKDLFIVMECVEGMTLTEYMARNAGVGSPLPLRAAFNIASQCLRALAVVHGGEGRIIHRDLKPGNILLVRKDGGLHVKICDFGVGKMTGTSGLADDATQTAIGSVVGTPAYMSPEQLFGDPNIDHRTDLYALGVVLYEMLSGSQPITVRDRRNMASYVRMHERGVMTPITRRVSGLPPAVAAVVHKALAKKGERFQSAREMEAALRAAVMPPKRRSAATIVTLTLLLLAAIGGIGAYANGMFRRETPAPAIKAAAPTRVIAPAQDPAPAPEVRAEQPPTFIPPPPEAGPSDAAGWYELGRKTPDKAKATEAYCRFLSASGRKDPGEVRFAKAWLRANDRSCK